MPKGSKNAISNRGEKTIKTCNKCNSVVKFVQIVRDGKNQKGNLCDCGILDNKGNNID